MNVRRFSFEILLRQREPVPANRVCVRIPREVNHERTRGDRVSHDEPHVPTA
jgi:hypothetical protein